MPSTWTPERTGRRWLCRDEDQRAANGGAGAAAGQDRDAALMAGDGQRSRRPLSGDRSPYPLPLGLWHVLRHTVTGEAVVGGPPRAGGAPAKHLLLPSQACSVTTWKRLSRGTAFDSRSRDGPRADGAALGSGPPVGHVDALQERAAVHARGTRGPSGPRGVAGCELPPVLPRHAARAARQGRPRGGCYSWASASGFFSTGKTAKSPSRW
jgi:hypothetical protein